MCGISAPIGAFSTSVPNPTLIPVSPVVNIGSDAEGGVSQTLITASVAVQLDSFSLMVVAYTFTGGNSSLAIVSINPEVSSDCDFG